MSSPTILDQIGNATRLRVEKRRRLPLPERPVSLPPASIGRFREAICRPSPAVPLRFLCEMKRSSPSKGILRADFEPAQLAHEYALHGADALSVLTEPLRWPATRILRKRSLRRVFTAKPYPNKAPGRVAHPGCERMMYVNSEGVPQTSRGGLAINACAASV